MSVTVSTSSMSLTFSLWISSGSSCYVSDPLWLQRISTVFNLNRHIPQAAMLGDALGPWESHLKNVFTNRLLSDIKVTVQRCVAGRCTTRWCKETCCAIYGLREDADQPDEEEVAMHDRIDTRRRRRLHVGEMTKSSDHWKICAPLWCEFEGNRHHFWLIQEVHVL